MHWDKYAPEEIEADDPRFLGVAPVEEVYPVPDLLCNVQDEIDETRRQRIGGMSLEAMAGMQQQMQQQMLANWYNAGQSQRMQVAGLGGQRLRPGSVFPWSG